GFQMMHLLADVTQLEWFLPQLTELCERRRLLIVVDNLDSLLTGDGLWRDARWGAVIGAMCAHAGLSRVVLTSRERPADVDSRVLAETVEALSSGEALMLARELPHLRELFDGEDPDESRELLARILDVTQGHPQMLELADSWADDLDRLPEAVAFAEQFWR